MKFRPLNENVLIRQHSKEKKTESGIVIPDTVRSGEAVLTGVVQAVCEVRKQTTAIETEAPIKVGDTVAFAFRNTIPVTFDEVEYVIVKEENLLGIKES